MISFILRSVLYVDRWVYVSCHSENVSQNAWFPMKYDELSSLWNVKKIVWLEISTKIHYHLETLWIRRYNRTSLTSAYVSKYLHIANIVFHCLHDELWVHRGFRWKISFRSYLLSPRYLSNLINYIYSWTRVRFTIISLIQWWAGIHCAFINNCFGGENSKKNTHTQTNLISSRIMQVNDDKRFYSILWWNRFGYIPVW